MTKFKGIIPAIITPFNEDGSVFEAGVENELHYLYQHGFRNIFACGSYGAFPTMSIEERKLVAERVIKFCRQKNMKTIIQIGSTSMDMALELAKHAEDSGADAVSSVVPFYYSSTIYTEYDFTKYFENIVKAVSIDVHCYNNVNTTGFNVSPKFLGELIGIGVCGMKDGGSDMGRALQMLDVIRDKNCEFDYYLSSTASLIIGFLIGVESCISGVALSVPELIMNIYESMLSKDLDCALNLYKKVMKVRSVLGSRSGRAIAAYDVLNYKGVNVGTCKAPWNKLNETSVEQMIEELKELGVI
jgi:dihydrodipicolinate synthase/N-acetylneuraminate lyase